MNFAVGVAATMTGVSILKQITGSGSNNAVAANYGTATNNGATNPTPEWGSNTPNQSPPGPTSGPNQYQNQRRAVGHSKRADIFGEPNSSHGL